MRTALRHIILAIREWLPSELFRHSEVGVWYDPSDSTTVFTDSAGTIPAVLEDPVGKILDKSGNGKHATQSTAASRPTLSARVNLLTKTEDFSDAAWTKGNATVTANTTTAPDGTTTADTIVEDTATSTHSIDQGASVSASTSYTVTVFAKPALGSRNIYIQINTAGGTTGAGSVWFDLASGVASAITTLAGTFVGVSASATASVSGWYKCEITFTTNTGNTYAAIYTGPYNAGRSYLGDGSSGIYIWGASLVPADQASLRYQRINTATDYATVGFPEIVNFDAVDDVLNTTFASALGVDCTVARAVVGQPPVILTGQNIGTSYAASTDHAGLIIVDRALTAAETASLTTYLTNKGAS